MPASEPAEIIAADGPIARQETLAAPDTVAEGAGPAAADDHQSLVKPGDVVDGTYRIKRLLGQGGMGQVWDAVDELLCRPVAIKAAWPKYGSSCLVQEGQALAALRHPVVPAVYGLAHHGPAMLLVMERLTGRTLERVIEERQDRQEMLSLEGALRILSGVAAALDAIHSAGICHRDLKPANIMLSPQGRVVLLDFGVFLPECAAAPRELIGTPYYIAPEAILEQVVPGQAYLSDLYSFGVMAYEVLTLKTPYTGRDLFEILNQHVHGEVPALRGLRPDAPPALEALVRDLMAKSPLDRPPGAAAVLSRLQRISRSSSESSWPGLERAGEPLRAAGFTARRDR
jgi:serine/threonine protein kinase